MPAPTDSTLAARPSPGAASRGGTLDLLRFSAAVLIMIYHFGNESPRKLYRLSEIFERGYLATDFFLMLSGYVLGRAYGPAIVTGHVRWGRFWLRRAARVWPAHLIVMAAFGIYVLGGQTLFGFPPNPQRFGLGSYIQQIFLIHAWSPLPPADGWNLPSWSLSVLLVCYLAFPWLWKALARVRPVVVLVLIGLSALVAGDSAARALLSHPLYDLPFQQGIYRAIPLFVFGACLAQAVSLNWPSERTAMALIWIGLIAVSVLQSFGRFDFLSMVAVGALILGAGRLPVRNPSAALEAAAKLSFALFITHTFIGLVYYDQLHGMIHRVKIPLPYQWLMWAAGFPLAIVAAWAFDRWIDGPIQRRIAPWLKARL